MNTKMHLDIDNVLIQTRTAIVSSDIDAMMAWENGTLSAENIVTLFQRLIDSGLAWELQRQYGRKALQLLECGACMPRNRGMTE